MQMHIIFYIFLRGESKKIMKMEDWRSFCRLVFPRKNLCPIPTTQLASFLLLYNLMKIYMYIVAPDTDIKENKIFLLYEDIQMGSGAKTYMRKCANIQPYMRRPLVIYDFAPDPFLIPLYLRKIFFSFLSLWDNVRSSCLYSLEEVYPQNANTAMNHPPWVTVAGEGWRISLRWILFGYLRLKGYFNTENRSSFFLVKTLLKDTLYLKSSKN